MSTTRGLRRTAIPLLAAAMLVQGVVGLAPHDHRPETVRCAPELGQHSPEAPDAVSIAAVAERLPASSCLACVITPLAFAQPEAALPPAVETASAPAASRPFDAVSLPRLWRSPLRGPPASA
jgi:hypothetical protein